MLKYVIVLLLLNRQWEPPRKKLRKVHHLHCYEHQFWGKIKLPSITSLHTIPFVCLKKYCLSQFQLHSFTSLLPSPVLSHNIVYYTIIHYSVLSYTTLHSPLLLSCPFRRERICEMSLEGRNEPSQVNGRLEGGKAYT